MNVRLVSPKPSKNQTIPQPYIALLKGQNNLQIIITDSETDVDGEKILASVTPDGNNGECSWQTTIQANGQHPDHSTITLTAINNKTAVYFKVYAYKNGSSDLIWQVKPLTEAQWNQEIGAVVVDSVAIPIDLGRGAVKNSSVYCAEYYTLSNIPNRKDLNKLTKDDDADEWVYFKLTGGVLFTYYAL